MIQNDIRSMILNSLRLPASVKRVKPGPKVVAIYT